MSPLVALLPVLAEQTSFALILGAIVALFGGGTIVSVFLVRSQNHKNEAEADKLTSEAEKTRVDSAAGLVAISERTLKNVESELKRQDRLIKELRAGDEVKDTRLKACDERIESLRRRIFEVLERLDALHDQYLESHDRYLREHAENESLRAQLVAEQVLRRNLEGERAQERSW